MRRSTANTGLINYPLFIVIGLSTVLFLLFFGLYTAANIVLNPIHSTIFATLVLLGLALSLIIFRYIRGPLVTEDMLESLQSNESRLPEIETLNRENSTETTSNKVTDDAPSQNTTNQATQNDADQLSIQDLPQDLYLKIIQNSDYTFEDAKQEYQNRH